MALKIYRDLPFNSGTEVDPTDIFTGDGTTIDFDLVHKTVDRLGAAIQFDDTQYFFFNGGYTKVDSNTFELSSAPPTNAQGVAPGLSNILFDDLYDQAIVDGITGNANIQEVPFYIADVEEIHLYTYVNLPSKTGIELTIVDNISATVTDTTWVQMACADTTSAGNALTYQATGTALLTSAIQAYGTLASSTSAGATTILVDTASTFNIGDYIMVAFGTAQAEVQKILGYTAPRTLTTTAMNFTHSTGDTVYACGRKFWMKTTVPIGIANGEAISLIDLSLKTKFSKRSRL